jgi:hypothetical protein
MQLLSCDTCGVVLDGDKLRWPPNAACINQDGSYSDIHTKYVDGAFCKKVNCPVCMAEIIDERRIV